MGLYDAASPDHDHGEVDLGHEHANADAPGAMENAREPGEAGHDDDTIPGESPIPWDRCDDYPKLALASLDTYAEEEQDVPSISEPPFKMEKSDDVSGKSSACAPAPTRSGEPSASATPPVEVSHLQR